LPVRGESGPPSRLGARGGRQRPHAGAACRRRRGGELCLGGGGGARVFSKSLIPDATSRSRLGRHGAVRLRGSPGLFLGVFSTAFLAPRVCRSFRGTQVARSFVSDWCHQPVGPGSVRLRGCGVLSHYTHEGLAPTLIAMRRSVEKTSHTCVRKGKTAVCAQDGGKRSRSSEASFCGSARRTATGEPTVSGGRRSARRSSSGSDGRCGRGLALLHSLRPRRLIHPSRVKKTGRPAERLALVGAEEENAEAGRGPRSRPWSNDPAGSRTRSLRCPNFRRAPHAASGDGRPSGVIRDKLRGGGSPRRPNSPRPTRGGTAGDGHPQARGRVEVGPFERCPSRLGRPVSHSAGRSFLDPIRAASGRRRPLPAPPGRAVFDAHVPLWVRDVQTGAARAAARRQPAPAAVGV